MAIKAVIFDCFGVLTTDGWKQIRTDIIQTDEARHAARDLDVAVNTGMIGYDEFVAQVAQLAELSVEQTRSQLNSTAANIRLFEYIRDELKPQYKIGLLSNAADNWLGDLFEPWQVRLFDEVVLSYAVGMVKPQPDIYDLMATKLGVLPEECVFIDDIERYITTAVDVGMKGIVFTSTEQAIEAITCSL
ncbi:MAG: HAD family phosphatase [Candidatus Saccharimonadales bacterium]